MKKILVLVLALALCCALAACGGDSNANNGLGNNGSVNDSGTNSIQAYVEQNRTALREGMAAAFEQMGLNCTADVMASGNGLVIKIVLKDVVNVTEEIKLQMQASVNQMQSYYDNLYTSMLPELPELSFLQYTIYSGDGVTLATVRAGK